MLRRWSSPRQAGTCQTQVNSGWRGGELPADGRLRLLSFNIQVGISTEKYRHYLTRGWQHLLPHNGRAGNLQKIGNLLGDFDLVALQEADGGSERSEGHGSAEQGGRSHEGGPFECGDFGPQAIELGEDQPRCGQSDQTKEQAEQRTSAAAIACQHSILRMIDGS